MRRLLALAVALVAALLLPSAALAARPAPVCDAQVEAAPDEGWTCPADASVTTQGLVVGTTSSKWRWTWSQNINYGIGTRLIGTVRNSKQGLSVWSGPAIKGVLTSRCVDDNTPGWMPDSICDESVVRDTVYRTTVPTNSDSVYLSEDERYWYEFWYKWWASGATNPSSADGAFYAKDNPYISDDWTCSKSYPSTEVCRFY